MGIGQIVNRNYGIPNGGNIFTTNNPRLLDRNYPNPLVNLAAFVPAAVAGKELNRRQFLKIAGLAGFITGAEYTGLAQTRAAYAAASSGDYLPFTWAVIGGGYDMLLKLVNKEDVAKSGDIAITGIDANALEIIANGSMAPSSVYDFNLPADGTFNLIAPSLQNTHLGQTPASLLVRPRNGNNISGTLYYLNNGKGATVRNAEPGTKRVIPIQIDSKYSAGIAIYNAGSRATDLLFSLYDNRHALIKQVRLSELEGAKLFQGAGYGRMVYELFTKGLPASFEGKLEIESLDNELITAIGLRVDNNNSLSTLKDSSPIVQPRQMAVMPHLVIDKKQPLEMILAHYGNSPEDGFIEFYKQPEGIPLALSVPSLGIKGNRIPVHFEPNGMAYIKAFYDGQDVTAGSARYASANGMTNVVGTLFFPYGGGLTSVQDAVVGSKIRVPIVQSSDIDAATSVFNPNEVPVNLTYTLKGEDGKSIDTRNFTLGPKQQLAKYLTRNSETFSRSKIGDTSGSLDISADKEIAVTGLGDIKQSGQLIGLEGFPYIIVPKTKRVGIVSVDSVEQKVLQGLSRTYVDGNEVPVVNGVAGVDLIIGKDYKIYFTNPNVFDEWRYFKFDRKGKTIAQKDIIRHGTLAIDDLVEQIIAGGIPNDWVDTKADFTNVPDLHRKEHMTQQLDFSGTGLRGWLNPNVPTVITNELGKNVDPVRQRAMDWIAYYNAVEAQRDNPYRYVFQDRPANNTDLNTRINNNGPFNHSWVTENTNIITRAQAELNESSSVFAVAEEMWEPLFDADNPRIDTGSASYMFKLDRTFNRYGFSVNSIPNRFLLGARFR